MNTLLYLRRRSQHIDAIKEKLGLIDALDANYQKQHPEHFEELKKGNDLPPALPDKEKLTADNVKLLEVLEWVLQGAININRQDSRITNFSLGECRRVYKEVTGEEFTTN